MEGYFHTEIQPNQGTTHKISKSWRQTEDSTSLHLGFMERLILQNGNHQGNIGGWKITEKNSKKF